MRGGFLEPVDPADREDAGCWVNRQLVALAVDFFAVGEPDYNIVGSSLLTG
ncbi:Uncharacterised protein [Mycobacterium tuberculosis]|nr:Uncharacterised protein [Mycobacterium tuberculosis]